MIRFLPKEELMEILSNSEENANPINRSANRFICGYVDFDEEIMILCRGNLENLVVPFSAFKPNAKFSPDFSKFSLDDYGASIALGDYEASADAVLYEFDPAYRAQCDAFEKSDQ